MMMPDKSDTRIYTRNILNELRADILRLEGFKSIQDNGIDIGLEPLIDSFPNRTFPLGAVHEFLSSETEGATSTSGFIAGLLSSLIGNRGAVAWVSSSRKLFPPGLKTYGIDPDHFIFIDLNNERDVIWAMEEALKCNALSAVIGEIREIDFTTSRRLQLAVEKSQVTGFILRNNYRKINTTASVSRWRITPMASMPIDGMPGIGFPQWKVELLRMRNGKSGSWIIQWNQGRFISMSDMTTIHQEQKKKAG